MYVGIVTIHRGPYQTKSWMENNIFFRGSNDLTSPEDMCF